MHALVEFIKEGCTAVVPMHCIVTTIKSLEEGESVNVLWSNRREYPAIYLLSGTNFFYNMKQIMCLYIYI